MQGWSWVSSVSHVERIFLLLHQHIAQYSYFSPKNENDYYAEVQAAEDMGCVAKGWTLAEYEQNNTFVTPLYLQYQLITKQGLVI